MPRPTYDYLLNQLRECQKENGALATDEEWNILTRKALPFRLKRSAESARWVVLARIHTTSLESARTALTGSIRRAVNVRAPECLERVRWNEREAGFILSSDPEGFCDRLRPIFRNEGLSVSMVYVPFSGSVQYDLDRAADALLAQVIKE